MSNDLHFDNEQGRTIWLGGKRLKAVDAVNQAVDAILTAAPGAANVCLVSIELHDAGGHCIETPCIFDLWLSDHPTGAGLTATTASGAVAAGGSGTDLFDFVAKKAKRAQSDVAGKYILSITDMAKTAFFVCVQLPHGKVATLQLTAANYES